MSSNSQSEDAAIAPDLESRVRDLETALMVCLMEAMTRLAKAKVDKPALQAEMEEAAKTILFNQQMADRALFADVDVSSPEKG